MAQQIVGPDFTIRTAHERERSTEFRWPTAGPAELPLDPPVRSKFDEEGIDINRVQQPDTTVGGGLEVSDTSDGL
jgi:hypothetical protein